MREELDKVILIIPSLNPDYHLLNTVRGMISVGFSKIIIVNDGSDKDHLEPFAEAKKLPQCVVLGYEVNKGKGEALKTAFRYVLANCPDTGAVVTADGDGQHTPEDTVRTAMAALEHPDKIVMGCRDFKSAGVPPRSYMGNTITCRVMSLFFGIHLSDTQTGLRGIPIQLLPFIAEIEGSRFEYESNMLLKANEGGIGFFEVKIQTLYEDENKGSHFKTVSDSWRIYKPILLFMASSISSTVIDLAVFTVLNHVLVSLPVKLTLFISTAGARICSSFYNYSINKRLVFKSEEKGSKTFIRYYILCACQMFASYLIVTGLTLLFGADGLFITLLKAFTDIVLFLISFRIQRRWVFPKKQNI